MVTTMVENAITDVRNRPRPFPPIPEDPTAEGVPHSVAKMDSAPGRLFTGNLQLERTGNICTLRRMSHDLDSKIPKCGVIRTREREH